MINMWCLYSYGGRGNKHIDKEINKVLSNDEWMQKVKYNDALWETYLDWRVQEGLSEMSIE